MGDRQKKIEEHKKYIDDTRSRTGGKYSDQDETNYEMWFEIGEVLPGDEGTKTVFSSYDAVDILREFAKLDQSKHFIDVWVIDENEDDPVPIPTTVIAPRKEE